MQILPDGARVAVARDGIYRAEPKEIEMRRTWAVARGSRPINISIHENRVLFGEYGGAEMDRVGVRIYCSFDGGKNFEILHEFARGDVHHIHNVVPDEYGKHYWVLAGDHGVVPGIAALSHDGKHLEWLQRGSQMVRAVNLLVQRDCLIYGTDSEKEPNFIVRLDKASGVVERLCPTAGSSLYAMQTGDGSFISTAVEPSTVNKENACHLYGSRDGENWTDVWSAQKDSWSATYFQFGTIVLPYVAAAHVNGGMFSGQALAGHHDRLTIFSC
jgi:hypothetical protein